MTKSNKNILLVCREMSSVENLLPVGEKLKELSKGLLDYTVIPLDEFYFQGLERILQEKRIPYLKVNSSSRLAKPIPFCNRTERFSIYLRNYKKIIQIVRGYNAVVVAGNNIPERMFAMAAEDQGKPVFFIHPALIFERPKKDSSEFLISTRIKTGIRKILSRVGVDFFRGTRGKLYDGYSKIFVAGNHNKKVLIKQGEIPSKIIPSGIPRYSKLFKQEKSKIPPKKEPFTALYATGAFLWHHDQESHLAQQQQLLHICKIIDALGERYRLIVKLHPREREDYYDWLLNWKEVIFSKEDIYRLIEKSNLILAIGSSVLLEAVLLNKLTAAVSFFHRDFSFYPTPLWSFIPVIKSPSELKKFILKINSDKNIYSQIVKKEKKILPEFIDPKTPFSAEIIAKQILKEV